MNPSLRSQLLQIARNRIADTDPSHDFEHALRVLANAERIAKAERADLDVVVPAALFHDVVNHPKNSPRASSASDESAQETGIILASLGNYPQNKIGRVCEAIRCCSFAKGIVPDRLETKIIQDSDGLESMGAISIMRTFASTGQMGRPFYNPEDPFCLKRNPDAVKYALDLFFTRLLVVESRMHTQSAKRIAKRRTAFLKRFLRELEMELKGK